MTFPFDWNEPSLRAADIDRLAPLFARTVTDFLPCDRAHLVAVPLQSRPGNVPMHWAEGVAQVSQKRQPLLDPGGESPTLFLPVWNGEGVVGVAVLEGGEPSLYDASVSWLLERSHLVSREFQLLKQCYQDPMTGLFSGRHLRAELDLLLADSGPAGQGRDSGKRTEQPEFCLVMVELSPRSRDAERAVAYMRSGGAYLDSLVGRSAPLCHFGAGVFGQIWSDVTVGLARKMAEALLLRLKRAGFARAHIGIVPWAAAQDAGVDRFLDLGWQGLRTARRRGPFSLCAHVSAEEVASHPLRPVAPTVRKKLGRWWRGRERFALLLVRQHGGADFSKRAVSLIGPETPCFPLGAGEVFVALAAADRGQALAWARSFQDQVKGVVDLPFSMGIALYPCHDFRKGEIPWNARKALVHTEFFGPGSITVFDGVSMNISGDVYYNEGDLPRALKEYRRGLAMDPDNVNLLNSLGVAYAQMNRHKMAVPCFEQVLRIDGENFMAFFNLGFAYLQTGRRREAVRCFERALRVDGQHFDLLLQLGRLYCEIGRYGEAIDLLERCEGAGSDEDRRNADYGAVQRYLGEAYRGIGKNREAMACLERALRFNPRDPAGLSMLGELYGLEGQGHDIALSLCGQAVEIDGSRAEYWYRYGLVQSFGDDDCGAIASLKQCLRLDRRHLPAMLLQARLCAKLGERARARRLYARVLRLSPDHAEAAVALGPLK